MADRYENQALEMLQGKFQAKVICCILGIGGLVAWNSLLTIADYYYHVFPDYHPSRVLTLVYQPFALVTVVILAYHESKINTRKRNMIGYTIFTISTLLLIALDLATKGRGGIGPYLGLCTIVASLGLADATVQGGMIGDLSLMCPELIQSYMAGLGVAGALTSAFRLMTKAAFENSNGGLRKGALIFLTISALIQFLCVMLYAYVFPKLPIVKYYRRKAASEGSKTVTADLAAAGIKSPSYLTDDVSSYQRLNKKEILHQNIDYAMNLSLTYILSLSIFPGFLYENTGQHGLGSWYALVLVAMYNCGNLIGRYTPLVKWLMFENRKWITIATLSRFLLIPAFYFTAKYGDQGWMIMLVTFLGWTTGHLNVCILIIAPKGYKGLCCFEIADGYENQAPQRFQGKFQAKVTCCILGIGCLASWNNMLTIADYYYHVFPDYHPSRVLTVVYQPFALGTIVILAYHESKINTRKRNLIGYIIFTISTLLLIVLDLTTRGRGGIGPYIGLCAIVASFGLAEATLALTSAFRLMTKAAFENSNDGLRKGAISLMLYAYVFPKLPIVNYYRRKVASEGSKTVNADLAAAGIQNQSYSTDDVSNNQRLSNKELLVQNIDYAVNLTLIYLISLSIFPGFLYENTGQHGLGSWYALVLVAMYNCGNMVGRYTPLVEWLKIENRKGLTLAVLSRFLFIPAFYKGPEKNALGNLLVVFLIGGIVAGTSLGWLWLIGKKNAF
ncbi:unnamed protein product [Brassica oleracea]|uniref:(rape) hypothetical protein n=1 Tax=Brassica napus TaxID=3708 RepID=A0A816J7I4_BRANA|nr:unnamed protein product [Brassica napus]